MEDWYSSWEQAMEAKKNIEIKTGINFVSWSSYTPANNRDGDDEDPVAAKHRHIRFGDSKGVVSGRYPYWIITRRAYECMYGRERHNARMKKEAAETERKMQEDHPMPRKRSYKKIQPTCKKNCSAQIIMKEVEVFLDFEMQRQTTWEKKQISQQIRECLRKKDVLRTETRIFVKLPTNEDHEAVHHIGQHTGIRTMENINLNAIEEAAQRIKGHIHVTPVMTCGMLNTIAPGRNLFFKCELLQKTGSFKIRGALNAVTKLIDSLPDGHDKPKVVTHSSGNFGQALAYAAQLKGLDAYIVMPETSPQCKINAVKGYGAEVIMCKPTEESRRTTGEEVQRRTGAHFFSPSQTYDVIAGQGTIGLELLDQIAELDAVIVPVGGGGMISGIATALKSKNPAIKVYAAEPENADDCFRSFQAKKLIPLPPGPVNTVADGLRVSIGPSTWPIIEKLVDDVITVTEEEIKDATRSIWQLMKLFIEPSAGVGVAAALSPKFSLKTKELMNVAVILCGGNVDVDAVKHWL